MQKTYNTVIVNKTQYEGGDLVLEVTGSVDGGADETFYFEATQGVTGVDEMYNIHLVTNGQAYDYIDINTNVTTNSNNKLKGSFSGTFDHFTNVSEPEQHTITSGSFDINY